MGHTAGEFLSEEESLRLKKEREAYRRERLEEISDIISNNPIDINDVEIGDTLKIYHPLDEFTRVTERYPRYEPQKIRRLFSMSTELYDMRMHPLSFEDGFHVYNKRMNQVRIDCPKKFDWLPYYIDIKYFEKK